MQNTILVCILRILDTHDFKLKLILRFIIPRNKSRFKSSRVQESISANADPNLLHIQLIS